MHRALRLAIPIAAGFVLLTCVAGCIATEKQLPGTWPAGITQYPGSDLWLSDDESIDTDGWSQAMMHTTDDTERILSFYDRRAELAGFTLCWAADFAVTPEYNFRKGAEVLTVRVTALTARKNVILHYTASDPGELQFCTGQLPPGVYADSVPLLQDSVLQYSEHSERGTTIVARSQESIAAVLGSYMAWFSENGFTVTQQARSLPQAAHVMKSGTVEKNGHEVSFFVGDGLNGDTVAMIGPLP